MNGVAKWVLNGGVAGVKTLGDMSGIDGWNDKIRRKRPVAVNAKDGPVFTDVSVSLVATRAGPTCQMALDGDMVADGMARDAFAQRHDSAAGFVTGYGSKGDVLSAPFVPLPNV